jgi:hypothetical protein
MLHEDLCKDCQRKRRELERKQAIRNSAVGRILETLANTGFPAGEIEDILSDIQRRVRAAKNKMVLNDFSA